MDETVDPSRAPARTRVNSPRKARQLARKQAHAATRATTEVGRAALLGVDVAPLVPHGEQAAMRFLARAAPVASKQAIIAQLYRTASDPTDPQRIQAARVLLETEPPQVQRRENVNVEVEQLVLSIDDGEGEDVRTLDAHHPMGGALLDVGGASEPAGEDPQEAVQRYLSPSSSLALPASPSLSGSVQSRLEALEEGQARILEMLERLVTRQV